MPRRTFSRPPNCRASSSGSGTMTYEAVFSRPTAKASAPDHRGRHRRRIGRHRIHRRAGWRLFLAGTIRTNLGSSDRRDRRGSAEEDAAQFHQGRRPRRGPRAKPDGRLNRRGVKPRLPGRAMGPPRGRRISISGGKGDGGFQEPPAMGIWGNHGLSRRGGGASYRGGGGPHPLVEKLTVLIQFLVLFRAGKT